MHSMPRTCRSYTTATRRRMGATTLETATNSSLPWWSMAKCLSARRLELRFSGCCPELARPDDAFGIMHKKRFSVKLEVLSPTAGSNHVYSSSYAAPGRQAEAQRPSRFRPRRPDSRPGQDQGRRQGTSAGL